MYITRDVAKIPKLKGRKEDAIEVEEWIDDVKHHIAVSRLNREEKIEFILQHLGGPAKLGLNTGFKENRQSPQMRSSICTHCVW